MVLLVVDAQKAITNEKLYEFEQFEYRVRRLIAHARDNGVEVVYVRHDDGAGSALTKGEDGFEIYEAFKPTADERIFDKTVNSPFKESGLLEYLKNKNVETIIVAGLQTDYCIDATVKCGFEHGFKMIVPENTNSTFDNPFMSAGTTYEYYNGFIWNNRYAQCVSFEEALAMIEEGAKFE